jgi:hypothetical protein
MPKLTDVELETVARACRAFAYQEGVRVKKIENPQMRELAEATVKRAATLAERFERARQKR